MRLSKQLSLCLLMTMTAAFVGCSSETASTGANTTQTSTMNVQTTSVSQNSTTPEYASKIFDTSVVHTINIEIDENEWQDMLDNATDKVWKNCNITIDGETIENVGIRAKGNSSLRNIASSDSDRYSFKVNFKKYEKDQRYYGLDKLALNNIIQDSTFMKDYLTYTLMAKMGVASPYVSYSYITVNGEDWGLYLNVEDIDSSFLERNYGEDHGELYKPETMEVGGQAAPNKKPDAAPTPPEGEIGEGIPEPPDGQPGEDVPAPPDNQGGQAPTNADAKEGGQASTNADIAEEGQAPTSGKPNGMPGFGEANAKGADLKYVDDEYDSYSNIFDNAETNIDDTDKNRLINSLKQISLGENIEDAVDIDALTRYFVVHNFVLNYDSYTGNMLHNYYLYEKDGKLTMLPWDYNLAFGAFAQIGGGKGGFNFDENFDPAQVGGNPPELPNNAQEQSAANNSTAQNNEVNNTPPAKSDENVATDNTEVVEKVDGEKPDTKPDFKPSEMPGGGTADATSQVNMAIDTPLLGTTQDARPMWSLIVSNDTYKENYHKLFDEFITNYVESGWINEEIDRVTALITPYVEKDPSGFYNAEQFKTGYETLKEFITLRGQSIRKQLSGEIASTTDEQNEETLVDASNINLKDMGDSGHMQGGRPDSKGGD